MTVKLIELNIKINVDDLKEEKRIVEPTKELPTVSTDYDNNQSRLNNNKIWYKTYIAGNKWIRIEGNGETPDNVKDVIVRRSPGNEDVLEDEITFNHKKYGIGLYEDYPKNLYIQSMRLSQLLNMGYSEGESNLIELVD